MSQQSDAGDRARAGAKCLTPEGVIAHIAWMGVDVTVADGVPAAEIEARLTESMSGLWQDAVHAQQRRRRGRKPKADRSIRWSERLIYP